jgi:secreted trypsin-like serine protease
LLAVTDQPDDDDDSKQDELRVIDGTSAAIGQFPFVVFIQALMLDENTTKECGGALISDNYVITAAQCVAS